MRCTDPRPDPITNSTLHYGDCCNEYGVTPKPLWVLVLQALLTALVFDLGGHIWTGKASRIAVDNVGSFQFLYLVTQAVMASVATYSILKSHN